MITIHIPCTAKFWWDKTLVNLSLQNCGEENLGEFMIASISYFSESGIWLSKISTSDACFVKVFLQEFCAIPYAIGT